MNSPIHDESGAIMVESIIVYGVTMILLFFILAIFSILYQYWNIQTIANEATTRVAQTYKYTAADTVTGYVSADDIASVRTYRYVFGKNEMPDSAHAKVVGYAQERLARTTFTMNASEPIVEVTFPDDGIARRHMMVTITGSYKVPFGEALDYLGLHGTTTYSVSACAQCVDVSDYIGTVSFVGSKAGLGDTGSKTLKALDSVLKFIDKIPNK